MTKVAEKQKKYIINPLIYDVIELDFSKYDGKEANYLLELNNTYFNGLVFQVYNYIEALLNSESTKESIHIAKLHYIRYKSKYSIYDRLNRVPSLISHSNRLGVNETDKSKLKVKCLEAIYKQETSKLDRLDRFQKELRFWYVSDIDLILNKEESKENLKENVCMICGRNLAKKSESSYTKYTTSLGVEGLIDISCGIDLGLDFVTKDDLHSYDIMNYLDFHEIDYVNVSNVYKKMVRLKEKALS